IRLRKSSSVQILSATCEVRDAKRSGTSSGGSGERLYGPRREHPLSSASFLTARLEFGNGVPGLSQGVSQGVSQGERQPAVEQLLANRAVRAHADAATSPHLGCPGMAPSPSP